MGNGPCGRTKGLRAKTRDLFSRDFRKKGVIPLTTYLRTYRIGEYVDIKANAAVQLGMPYKFYHGKTGVVWNVNKRSVGVEVFKKVKGKFMKKRIHVRIEHVQPSRCREEFLARRADNDARKAEAKKRGEHLIVKRKPAGPHEGAEVAGDVELVTPFPYDILREGVQS